MQEKKLNKAEKRKMVLETKPAANKAPLSQTSTERIRLKLSNFRIENKALKEQVLQLEKEIQTSSVEVGSSLNEDLISIISNTNETMPSFMKLFWDEQQKYINKSSTKGIR